MKKVRMNIARFHFILLNMKIFSEILISIFFFFFFFFNVLPVVCLGWNVCVSTV